MKKIKEEIAYYLWFWFELMPSTWFGYFYCHKFNKAWDDALSHLIDKHSESITRSSNHTVSVRGVEVWVSNRYYAFGHEGGQGYDYCYRPSARTMYKLATLLDKAQKDYEEAARQAYRERLESMLHQ